MKDQFETHIKELVNDFAYEYDPKAWEALSKKLPKRNSGFSSTAKLVGVLAIALGVLTFWMLHEKDQQQNPALAKERNVQKIEDADASAQIQNVNAVKSDNSQNNINANTSEQISEHEVVNQETVAKLLPEVFATEHVTQATPTTQIHTPRLSANQPSQVQVSIAPEKPQLSNSTTSPCKGPKISLEADAINYEDGTPRIKLTAESNGSDITWSANGALQNKKSRSVELLAFKGQTYTISAQAQLDGCVSTEKIKITANEDYNLLAVNAFNPSSSNERNARFMPYALTIREVRFELVILDPDNGAVVFKTSDAQNAWDGIDMRNGQLIPAQKAYIWKVVLQDALPNEKTTYTGTIVRI